MEELHLHIAVQCICLHPRIHACVLRADGLADHGLEWRLNRQTEYLMICACLSVTFHEVLGLPVDLLVLDHALPDILLSANLQRSLMQADIWQHTEASPA